jgi:hypothetical protein
VADVVASNHQVATIVGPARTMTWMCGLSVFQ